MLRGQEDPGRVSIYLVCTSTCFTHLLLITPFHSEGRAEGSKLQRLTGRLKSLSGRYSLSPRVSLVPSILEAI